MFRSFPPFTSLCSKFKRKCNNRIILSVKDMRRNMFGSLRILKRKDFFFLGGGLGVRMLRADSLRKGEPFPINEAESGEKVFYHQLQAVYNEKEKSAVALVIVGFISMLKLSMAMLTWKPSCNGTHEWNWKA